MWTREELERMGDICLKHGVFVISDEIHSDFVYGDNKHIVFPTVKKEFEDICAVCTAPTKTFNLAGLHIANTYVKSDVVRGQLKRELDKQGYSQPNVMGLIACEAAYKYGAEWLEQLKAYLEQNLRLVRDYIACIKGIELVEPQGTYLVWLDCRALKLSEEELSALFQNKAKLWLDDGFIFGAGGSDFVRINIACPSSVLKLALDRIKRAVNT